MTDWSSRDTIVVLDFGSQFAQLIARRVRELNVYSELLPHDTPWAEIERRAPKGIILSGGPCSVYDDDAPRPDPAIWQGRIPVLGICYGAQLMAHELGGDVLPTSKREYGPATVTVTEDDGLFTGPRPDQPVWMSHGDSITRLPDGLQGDCPDGFVAVCRARRPVTQPVRDPVPSGGRPHARRPRRPAQLRRRDRRAQARPGRRPTSSIRRSPTSGPASMRTRPRPDRTASSSAHCPVASTPPWRPPSSTGPSAIG